MKRFRIILGMVVAFYLIGCQKEMPESEVLPDSHDIEEAKAWFNAQMTGSIELKSGKECKQIKVAIPQWNDTRASKNKQMEIVEVGLKVQGGWGFITETSHSEWLNTNNQGYLYSNTRLVIRKNIDTGKRVSFLMTLVGDKPSLEKKKFRLWQGNSYLKKDSDFSGLVLFHDLDGRFVNGWRFTSGKVTHTIKLNFENPLEIRLKSSYCYTVPLYGWFENCTDWYYYTISNGVESGLSPNGTSCGIPYVDILGYVNECYYYDEGSGGSGGYYEDMGGGLGNSNTVLTAEVIFTNEFDKINLNGTNVFERVVCLIRDLYFNNPGLLTPDMFYGSGDKYLYGYNIAVKEESIFGHEVKTVVVFDYDNLPNQIQKRTEKHGSKVVFHEIRVRASMNSTGEMPKLISLQFKPEDAYFCEQVFYILKGRQIYGIANKNSCYICHDNIAMELFQKIQHRRRLGSIGHTRRICRTIFFW